MCLIVAIYIFVCFGLCLSGLLVLVLFLIVFDYFCSRIRPTSKKACWRRALHFCDPALNGVCVQSAWSDRAAELYSACTRLPAPAPKHAKHVSNMPF